MVCKNWCYTDEYSYRNQNNSVNSKTLNLNWVLAFYMKGEFSIIDHDKNIHYFDIRKRHTSIFDLDSIWNCHPCVHFQRPDATYTMQPLESALLEFAEPKKYILDVRMKTWFIIWLTPRKVLYFLGKLSEITYWTV